MKEVTPAAVQNGPAPPSQGRRVSDVGRQLAGIWEQLDAAGGRRLSLDELQREALDDAD